MELVDTYTYQVNKGEVVEIHIVPYDLPLAMATLSLDGGPSQQTNDFRFTASQQQHVIQLAAHFHSPETARYEIEVSGSNGGHFPIILRKDGDSPTRLLTLHFIGGDTGPK